MSTKKRPITLAIDPNGGTHRSCSPGARDWMD
jgi:hypothetical protein